MSGKYVKVGNCGAAAGDGKLRHCMAADWLVDGAQTRLYLSTGKK